jgi:hypothetical protein
LTALANLRQNLHYAISKGDALFHPRIFTEGDIANIQTSCLEILRGFQGTCDYVSYFVVTGSISVELCAHSRTLDEEVEWFDKLFYWVRYPDWKGLGGKIIDLEQERYEPYKNSKNEAKVL